MGFWCCQVHFVRYILLFRPSSAGPLIRTIIHYIFIRHHPSHPSSSPSHHTRPFHSSYFVFVFFHTKISVFERFILYFTATDIITTHFSVVFHLHTVSFILLMCSFFLFLLHLFNPGAYWGLHKIYRRLMYLYTLPLSSASIFLYLSHISLLHTHAGGLASSPRPPPFHTRAFERLL